MPSDKTMRHKDTLGNSTDQIWDMYLYKNDTWNDIKYTYAENNWFAHYKHAHSCKPNRVGGETV